MKYTTEPTADTKVLKRLRKYKAKLSECRDSLQKYNEVYQAALRKIARAKVRKARLVKKLCQTQQALELSRREVQEKERKLLAANDSIEQLEQLKMRAVW